MIASVWKARIPDYHGEEWKQADECWAIYRGAYSVACAMAEDYCDDDPGVVACNDHVQVEVMDPDGNVTRWIVEWEHTLSFNAKQEATPVVGGA